MCLPRPTACGGRAGVWGAPCAPVPDGSLEGRAIPTIEVTRAADLPVVDQLAEMRAWLDREGIRLTELRALRVLAGRITFEATFAQASDADRFRQAFDRR
jgi:hypothetical protein